MTALFRLVDSQNIVLLGDEIFFEAFFFLTERVKLLIIPLILFYLSLGVDCNWIFVNRNLDSISFVIKNLIEGLFSIFFFRFLFVCCFCSCVSFYIVCTWNWKESLRRKVLKRFIYGYFWWKVREDTRSCSCTILLIFSTVIFVEVLTPNLTIIIYDEFSETVERWDFINSPSHDFTSSKDSYFHLHAQLCVINRYPYPFDKFLRSKICCWMQNNPFPYKSKIKCQSFKFRKEKKLKNSQLLYFCEYCSKGFALLVPLTLVIHVILLML